MTRGFAFEQKPATDEWFTPGWLMDGMGVRWDLDPCGASASEASGWCERVVTDHSGLAMPWEGSVFLNPPYSQVGPFCDKLVASFQAGVCNGGVALVYARTDTAWAQHLLENAGAALFLRKRVHFVPGGGQRPSSPGAPSMLVGMGVKGLIALAKLRKHGILLARAP